MDVATRLAPCEDDPAILRDNFDSVVREIPRANLANQNVALSIGSTHKFFLPMGAILTPIVYLQCSTSSKPALIFPGMMSQSAKWSSACRFLPLSPNRHRTAWSYGSRSA
jgi:hypothetical protein